MKRMKDGNKTRILRLELSIRLPLPVKTSTLRALEKPAKVIFAKVTADSARTSYFIEVGVCISSRLDLWSMTIFVLLSFFPIV